MKSKIIFPKLFDANGDVSKNWIVAYSVENPKTHSKQRFKEYISKRLTAKQRYDVAKKLIENLTLKLNSGWLPFDDLPTYESVTQYRKNYASKTKPVNFTFEYHLNAVLGSPYKIVLK